LSIINKSSGRANPADALAARRRAGRHARVWIDSLSYKTKLF
jgi:hypothetical protein